MENCIESTTRFDAGRGRPHKRNGARGGRRLNVIFICNPLATKWSNLSMRRGKRVEKYRFLKRFLASVWPDSPVWERDVLLRNYHIRPN